MSATMTEDQHAKEISSGWQNDVYEALRRNGVTQFSYVPDAGHRICIDRSIGDKDVHSIALTTEEEGVALACGAHLGGARSVLLMQSSGLGNCVNFMSMVQGGRFPFLTILSMRGEFGEGNPWQMGMGQATRPILNALDFVTLEINSPEEVGPTIDAACNMVWKSGQAVAVLLTQKLIGAKAF
jgi:sulfopyruvate decarboxylase alpha subunit